MLTKARWVAIALMVVTCGGCAQQRMNAALQNFHSAETQCSSRKQSGELKSQREWALCVNQAQLSIVGPIEPHSDLLAQETAYRIVLADQVDRKLITVDEANLKWAQFRSTLSSEGGSRAAVQAQIDSENAATALMLMNANRPQPVLSPSVIPSSPPSIPPPATTPPAVAIDNPSVRPLYTPPPLTPPAGQQVLRCGNTALGVSCY